MRNEWHNTYEGARWSLLSCLQLLPGCRIWSPIEVFAHEHVELLLSSLFHGLLMFHLLDSGPNTRNACTKLSTLCSMGDECTHNTNEATRPFATRHHSPLSYGGRIWPPCLGVVCFVHGAYVPECLVHALFLFDWLGVEQGERTAKTIFQKFPGRRIQRHLRGSPMLSPATSCTLSER